jgi:hypothetical protein
MTDAVNQPPRPNPSPATKMQVRGPFSNRERAFCMLFANGFANEGGSGGLVA